MISANSHYLDCPKKKIKLSISECRECKTKKKCKSFRAVVQRELPFNKPAFNKKGMIPDIYFVAEMPVTAYFQKKEGSLWQREKEKKRPLKTTTIILIIETAVLLSIFVYSYFHILML
jgi:hypothetical protein